LAEYKRCYLTQDVICLRCRYAVQYTKLCCRGRYGKKKFEKHWPRPWN